MLLYSILSYIRASEASGPVINVFEIIIDTNSVPTRAGGLVTPCLSHPAVRTKPVRSGKYEKSY